MKFFAALFLMAAFLSSQAYANECLIAGHEKDVLIATANAAIKGFEKFLNDHEIDAQAETFKFEWGFVQYMPPLSPEDTDFVTFGFDSSIKTKSGDTIKLVLWNKTFNSSDLWSSIHPEVRNGSCVATLQVGFAVLKNREKIGEFDSSPVPIGQ